MLNHINHVICYFCIWEYLSNQSFIKYLFKIIFIDIQSIENNVILFFHHRVVFPITPICKQTIVYLSWDQINVEILEWFKFELSDILPSKKSKVLKQYWQLLLLLLDIVFEYYLIDELSCFLFKNKDTFI